MRDPTRASSTSPLERWWAGAVVAALIATTAGPAAARSLNGAPGAALLRRAGDGGTVGAKLGDVPADTVGVRYHLRVNASSGHVNRKFVFIGVRTATPGGSGVGTIETDVV